MSSFKLSSFSRAVSSLARYQLDVMNTWAGSAWFQGGGHGDDTEPR